MGLDSGCNFKWVKIYYFKDNLVEGLLYDNVAAFLFQIIYFIRFLAEVFINNLFEDNNEYLQEI